MVSLDIGTPILGVEMTHARNPPAAAYVACQVLVLNSETMSILMSCRRTGYGGGIYGLPGGKMYPDDRDLQQCAKRELKEETDLDVREEDIFPICRRIGRIPGRDTPVFSVGVFVFSYTGNPKQMEKQKNGDWQWFGVDALPDDVFGPAQEVIDSFLARPMPKLQWSVIESERWEFENRFIHASDQLTLGLKVLGESTGTSSE